MTAKPLILKKYNREQQNSIEVDGNYAQHLKPFQIHGIRFLFRNYINGLGTILNDESGLGKTVQTVLFLSAVRGLSKPTYSVLILSTDENINHWRFHFHKWSEEHISINNEDHQRTNFTISSLEKCAAFLVQEWDVVVVDDLEINTTIKNLREIKCGMKIWLTKNNLHFDLHKMFGLMNWISNETIGKRNKFLHNFCPSDGDNILTQWKKRQLLDNFCNQWVLRRVRDNLKAELPLIDEQIYQKDLQEWHQGLIILKKLPEVSQHSDIVCIHDDWQDNNSPTNDKLTQSSLEITDSNNEEIDFQSPSMLDCTLYCNRSLENSDDFMKRKGTKDISGLKIKKTKPELGHDKINKSFGLSVNHILSDSRSDDANRNIVENQSGSDAIEVQMNITESVSKHQFLDTILNSFKSVNKHDASLKKPASTVSVIDNSNVKESMFGSLRERKKETDTKVNVLGSISAYKPHFLDVLFESKTLTSRIVKPTSISLPSSTHYDAQLKQPTKYITDNKLLSDCRSQTENSQIKSHFKMLDNILFASRQ